MCVIVIKPKGIAVPHQDIVDCSIANPDGFGFMYTDKGKVKIERGFFDVWDFINTLEELVGKHKAAVLHFRIATAGKINMINCHPFPISSNLKQLTNQSINCKMGFCHNGIIQSDTFSKVELTTYSDSVLLIRDVLSKVNNVDAVLPIISDLSYSKFCTLDNKGNIKTYGNFHSINDCLYSNLNWVYVYAPKYGQHETLCEWCQKPLGDDEEITSGLCHQCIAYEMEAEKLKKGEDINDYCDYCGELKPLEKYIEYAICQECENILHEEMESDRA